MFFDSNHSRCVGLMTRYAVAPRGWAAGSRALLLNSTSKQTGNLFILLSQKSFKNDLREEKVRDL